MVLFRSQIGQLKMWSNNASLVRNADSEPVGTSEIGQPKKHTMVVKHYQRMKMEQILYKMEEGTEDQMIKFMNVPDYISGKKVDPITEKTRNFRGTTEERKRLEAMLRRDQQIGGNEMLNMKVKVKNGTTVITKPVPDMGKKLKEVQRDEDLSNLVPMCTTKKTSYFRGRDLQGKVVKNKMIKITIIMIQTETMANYRKLVGGQLTSTPWPKSILKWQTWMMRWKI